MKKRIAFIVNPVSGTNKRKGIEDMIRSELDMEKYDYVIQYTAYKGNGTELSARFVQEGYDIVVAVGGDGTVNEVAKALINSSVALGIIAVGSGNGLARHLNIPMNVRKAIQQLNESEVIKIDYGVVNEKLFFCTCGTGFDAYVSLEFAKGQKKGIIGYLEKVITGYFNYEPQNYHLVGKDIDREYLVRKVVQAEEMVGRKVSYVVLEPTEAEEYLLKYEPADLLPLWNYPGSNVV